MNKGGKLLVGLMMITLLFSACTTESIPTDSKSGFQSIEEIKAIVGKVKPGQPQSHIKQLIGDQFVEFKNPDGSVEWRYDFGTNKNYTFGQESPHEGKADVTGIEQEKVLATVGTIIYPLGQGRHS